jgi:hypothetical protein
VRALLLLLLLLLLVVVVVVVLVVVPFVLDSEFFLLDSSDLVLDVKCLRLRDSGDGECFRLSSLF